MEHLYLQIDDLKIEVKVVATRTIFGREEVEVSPVAGSGTKWVNKDKLIRVVEKVKTK